MKRKLINKNKHGFCRIFNDSLITSHLQRQLFTNKLTDIVTIFLKLVDKNFSSIHRLHKILNHNTIKVSYSQLRNTRAEKIIYKCTSLTKNNIKKVYLGISEGRFKKNWYYNHQQLFQNEYYKNTTTLSTYF